MCSNSFCSRNHTGFAKLILTHISAEQAYPRYTIAATALKISANGLAKLAISRAPLVGAAASLLPVELADESSAPVVAAAVDDAPVEVVLRRVGLLMVVFLIIVVPVAAPEAPDPTAPVPTATVVVALLAATVVLIEVLFAEASPDWRTALAKVAADVVAVPRKVVAVTADGAEVAEDEVPPERLKRPE